MERENQTNQGAIKAERPTVRGWTHRVASQVRYRRFTDIDRGEAAIFFKFDLPPGQTEIPQAVYDILHEFKYLEPTPSHGRHSRPTGLRYDRNKNHGRVWRLPDTEMGRSTADIVDRRLLDLFDKLNNEHARDR